MENYMTTGIYKLNFNGTTKVYIGQSINIEERFTKHLMYMRKGKASEKLNLAYRDYDQPTLEILCECSINELDKYEDEAIEIFNSVESGFNTYDTARGISTMSGDSHYNSKYTTKQYVEAMLLLLDVSVPINEISVITGISTGSINVFSRGNSHTYIKEIYPEEYTKMISLVGKRKVFVNTAVRKGIVYPTVISPEGVEYPDITNAKEFASIHNIPYDGFHRLLRGSRKSTKGWVIKS
jgi:hypothetical protein